MSALTVTLGGDLAGLKAAMAGAVELVSASAKRMGATACVQYVNATSDKAGSLLTFKAPTTSTVVTATEPPTKPW